MELRLAEASEDLLEGHSGNDTAVGVEVDMLADNAETSIATGIGAFVGVVGAVGVGERLPAADHHRELVEPQTHSVTEQQLHRIGKLITTARVGEHPSQQPKLGHTHRTGMSGDPHRRDSIQHSCALHH